MKKRKVAITLSKWKREIGRERSEQQKEYKKLREKKEIYNVYKKANKK